MTDLPDPAEVVEALSEEVLFLFDDLSKAQQRAINRKWSIGCDWLIERIQALVAVGAKLPRIGETTMSPGLYRHCVRLILEDTDE